MLVPDLAMQMGERIKVLDFGLAKLSEVREAAVVNTNSQALLGTPIYMSPEQCEGAGRVDAKSDVYALGCMLYEMLSGQPPFQGDGPGQVIGQHLFKQPVPLGKVAPSVPAALSELVDRLLIKPKEQRPSMREVQRALESLAAELPAPPRRQEAEGSEVFDATQVAVRGRASTLGRTAAETHRPRRRHAWMVGAGGALAVLATAALLWPARHPSPPMPVAKAVTALPVVSLPPPAPSAPVILRVVSQPSGAQIVRLPDGAVLGTTPWQQEMLRTDDPLRVRVRLNRYAERELLLSRQRDDAADVKLVAAPAQRHLQPMPAPKNSAQPPARKGLRIEK